MLNFMRHMKFAAFASIALAASAAAQTVPARELLDFPIATLGAPNVLSQHAAHGWWNPATIAQPRSTRLHVAAATLNAPADQGVSAQLLSAALPIAARTTVGLTLVRASVSDIFRTDTDPQTLGPEIPYNTTVISTSVSRKTGRLSTGIATRLRMGQFDGTRDRTLDVDGGLLLTNLGTRDMRIGASTFLWTPGRGKQQARYSSGADLALWGRDTLRTTRGGYAFSMTPGSSREHYFFGSSRLGMLELLGGFAREIVFQHTNSHVRLGIGLHYSRYIVGVSREDNGAGVGSTYQFLLTSVFQ